MPSAKGHHECLRVLPGGDDDRDDDDCLDIYHDDHDDNVMSDDVYECYQVEMMMHQW